jgi:hypothetical protein
MEVEHFGRTLASAFRDVRSGRAKPAMRGKPAIGTVDGPCVPSILAAVLGGIGAIYVGCDPVDHPLDGSVRPVDGATRGARAGVALLVPAVYIAIVQPLCHYGYHKEAWGVLFTLPVVWLLMVVLFFPEVMPPPASLNKTGKGRQDDDDNAVQW